MLSEKLGSGYPLPFFIASVKLGSAAALLLRKIAGLDTKGEGRRESGDLNKKMQGIWCSSQYR